MSVLFILHQNATVAGFSPPECPQLENDSHGSSISLCPTLGCRSLGSPPATTVTWFWSHISRMAWNCARTGGKTAGSVGEHVPLRTSDGDAASAWATWVLSPRSPDIFRESFSFGEGMKLKANQLPREWGNLAAEQRRAVCCRMQPKISHGGNKGATLFPHESPCTCHSSVAAPGTPGRGWRGRLDPAQTSPRHPSGALRANFQPASC